MQLQFGMKYLVSCLVLLEGSSSKKIKRQIPSAPYFPQTSYTFTACPDLTSAYPVLNGPVGMVTASGGSNIVYSIDPGSSSNDVFIDPSYGQIAMQLDIPGTRQFTVRATNLYGSATATVSVVNCNGIQSQPGISFSQPQSQPGISFGQPQSQTGPTFSQSSYSFSYPGCYPRQPVGNVYANNAVSYAISQGSDKFGISPSGAISTVDYVMGGTYTMVVIAYGPTGMISQATVTAVATCGA